MKIYKPNPVTGEMEVFQTDQNDPRYHVPPSRQTESRQPLGEPFPQPGFKRPNQTYMMGDTPANPIIPERNRIYRGGEIVSNPTTPISVDPVANIEPVQNVPVDTINTVINQDVNIFDDEGSGYDNMSFGDAFNQARSEGLRIFEWKGGVYNTNLKESENKIQPNNNLSERDSLLNEWNNSPDSMKAQWDNDFEKWFKFVTYKAGDPHPSNEVNVQKQTSDIRLGGIDWGKQTYEVVDPDDNITIYNFGEGPLPASYFNE